MNDNSKELCFTPLGGVGEIGMNLGVYTYGTEEDKEYLIVDMGVSFAGEEAPGADLVLPDISFLEGEAVNIVGLVITHGHEDHYGAVAELWPLLKVPIYCTAFTAALLQSKFTDAEKFKELPLHIFKPGDKFKIGEFTVDTIQMNHSIPEATALAIKTSAGTVVHTGDWKIDDSPALGDKTDLEKLKKLGDEGVLALVCDSTNAAQSGGFNTEATVKTNLEKIIAKAKGRVAITTFSSNVGRIISMIKAARANDRKILLLGRSIKRVVNIAIDLGYIGSDETFLSEQEYNEVPRDKLVIILTGSQGEMRAALSKLADGAMKQIELSRGDCVVYSSRMIPGNEKLILRVQNALIDQGVELITVADQQVHVSGHASQDELKKIYELVRPKILVPVHGEAIHLEAHAKFATKEGIGQIARIRNGDMLLLSGKKAKIIDEVPVGRLYRDGKLLGYDTELGINVRKKLAQVGHIAVFIVLTNRLNLAFSPKLIINGLPAFDQEGESMYDLIHAALEDLIDDLPAKKLKNKVALESACNSAVVRTVEKAWGKRPLVTSVIHYISR
ncbi:ribonuclease J [Bartonella sp. TP]|uniref:ribonuclease J n=1 Tax=Bartonella sp. TP TaxID=3057550 RepID=UPI0025B07851|nr:ribonuclease J [Bartonella sp. TP]WJW79940.1 ribonuclease J [Bartonella sp. TP]